MAEDQPSRSDSADSSTSPEAVGSPRNLEAEKEAAWSKFMDDMENKLPQTGQYFLRLGKKTGAHMSDNRAFILIKPVFDPKEGTAQYVVISRKGARGTNQKDIESNFQRELNNVRQSFPNDLERVISDTVIRQEYIGSPFIQFLKHGGGGRTIINMDSEMEEEAVKTAIKESMELVKTTAAEHQISKANSLSAFLDTLLPGEAGPSAPPSPPTNP